MGRRGITLENINPRYLPQIEAQLAKAKKPVAVQVSDKPRIRQSTAKVSLLEERWGKELAMEFSGARIYPQFPLRIGNGSNYYVDYLVVVGDRRKPSIHAFEVKGPYARAAGIVKLKAAASIYPWIRFELVSSNHGKWVRQEVLP